MLKVFREEEKATYDNEVEAFAAITMASFGDLVNTLKYVMIVLCERRLHITFFSNPGTVL